MPLPINIDDLIKGNLFESDRMEFKKGWNPEAILHTICAFANDFNNTGGGYIIVGIEEDNHVAKLPPEGLNQNQIEPIQQELHKICYYLSPNYFPIVSPEIYNDKDIIVIWVPPGDLRPYKAPKRIGNRNEKVPYIRRMASTVQATPEEDIQLKELSVRIPFDNRTNMQASLDDINLTHVTTFLHEVKSSLYDEVFKTPAEDIYLKMDIARGPEEIIRPLNVGLLLFSNEPHKFFRGAQIDLVIYHDTVGDKFTEKIFRGPLYMQLRESLAYIKSNIIREEVRKIEGIPEADRFYNYPYEAIKEALANAVYHKSYEKENPIEINFRPDCIEILSFPGPIPPVDNDMLKRDRIVARDYRNSRIGDFLKELHLTEGRGTGIPKIRNLLKKNGSPDPVFETDEDRTYFLTTLKPHPDSVLKSKKDHPGTKLEPGKNQVGTKLAPSRHQVKIMRECSTEARLLSLMKVLGRSDRTKFRNQVLNPLIDEELVQMTIPDKPTSNKQKYLLTDKGKRLLEELDSDK